MFARTSCCCPCFSLPPTSLFLLQRPSLDASAAKKKLLFFAAAASSSNFLNGRTALRPVPLRLPRPAARRRTAAVASALQDAGAAVLCVAGAYSLVRSFDALTESNIVEKSFSRKAVHVLSGLLYMSSWPFFSSSMEARYFAAIVPLLNCIRLIIYGFGFITDEGLIKSVSREGKAEELLRGPLYYVMVLLLCAIIFWRESPVGIVSLAIMSGGDGIIIIIIIIIVVLLSCFHCSISTNGNMPAGFADIIGRRYGTTKLPYNQHKSWIGTISMFISGFAFSIGMLYYFSCFGCLNFDWEPTIQRVALVSLASALVESLPISHIIDDNISVPVTSMVTALVLFEYIPR